MKSRTVLRSFGLGLAILTCSMPGRAAELTLTADAHVNAARAGANFGSIANLYVDNGSTALLAFDLGSLPAGVPPGQISRATLTLFVNRVNQSGVVSVAPVTSAWSEGNVTYATRPSTGSPSNAFTVALAGQYVTLDVTALVQAWVNNPSTNNGIALSSAGANVLFDSKENDQTAHPAKLDVTITSMGATGATGATGVQGPQGIQGLAGAQGLPGATGVQGSQGIQGLAGATGATGVQGIQGTTGVTGAVGATGAQGLQGVAGVTGATGIAGATGATGVAGSTGVTGVTGVTGAIGATGVMGATGATGNTVGGNYSVASVYFPGSVVAYGGQTYLGLVTNQGITPGTDPTVWSLVTGGGSAGATGATGPQGLPGIQGATGATGAQGTQGATGVTGTTGATGSTGAAGVAGSTGATGAVGATGSTGQVGAAGVTGATGATGVAGATGAAGFTGATGAAGAIAYQGVYSSTTTYAQNAIVSDSNYYNSYVSLVANNTGHSLPSSGANAYWAVLASQGAQGLPGSAGVTGSTGATGAVGATGSTGATGATGSGGSGGGTPTLSAWSSSTSYSAGALVTYNGSIFLAQQASINITPTSTAAAGYWAGLNPATGTSPVGIPYNMSTHEFSSTYPYHNPAAGSGSAGSSPNLGAFSTIIVPTACTPSYTIYNASPAGSTGTPINFQLVQAIPSSSATNGSGWTTGSAYGGVCSITSPGANGSVPLPSGASCTVNNAPQIAAGTPITLLLTNVASQSSTFYTFYVAFSCQ